ncbi:MAG TPA: hypothetical protein VHP80_19390 [Candidatus Acidoferrum sp.]|nr:hypothetical protein [Candidatus Acidoferrum sp.]
MTSLLVITAACVVGLKPKPEALGVTAYVPADKPEKAYVPLLAAVVVAVAAPLKDKVVAALGAGLTVPEIANVVCPPGVPPPGVVGVETLPFGLTVPVQPTLHTKAPKMTSPNQALPLDTAPLWNCLEDRISLQPFSV